MAVVVCEIADAGEGFGTRAIYGRAAVGKRESS